MLSYSKTGFTAPEGALDFSFMADAPAGKHGFLKTKDGHFVFEDGTPVKFFGVNLVFDGAICDKEAAPEIVNDLWRSGCNMVRLHHVDTRSKSSLIDYSNGDSQHYSAEGIDKLDYMISLLREKGIYIHIDTNTLRSYMPADGFEEADLRSIGGTVKTVQFYDEKIIELQKKYIRYYLTHVNPYTGLRYCDDPAVAIVQFVNENSITFVPQNPDAVNYFSILLDKKFNAWLIEKYGTREALDAAWTDCDGVKALAADEDPIQGTVRRPMLGVWNERMVGADKDYTSLEGAARMADMNEFLMQTERQTFGMIYAFMRSIGVKCLINCSNIPTGPIDLLCNTDGDVTENNGYWNHPINGYGSPESTFHDLEMCAVDPRIEFDLGFSQHLIFKLSTARAHNKPLVITECNAPYATPFRVDALLQLASYGAFHDWDGILLFDYTGSSSPAARTRDKMDAMFDSCVDPAIWGFFGIASMIFRRQMIDKAKNSIEIVYSEADCRNAHPDIYSLFRATTYLSKTAVRFIGDKYYGDADVALASGFTATGDYTAAKHAIVHSSNPYSDCYHKHRGVDAWLASQTGADAKKVVIPETNFDSYIDDRALSAKIPEFHTIFDGKLSNALDYAMKHWGLLSEEQGWLDGRVVSDTSQLALNYEQGNFTAASDCVNIFAGHTLPADPAPDSDYPYFGAAGDMKLYLENDKAGVAVISLDGKPISESRKILVRAMGICVNSEMVWENHHMMSKGHAPILYDDMRGILALPLCGCSETVTVQALEDLGAPTENMEYSISDGTLRFKLGGHSAYVITRA